MARFFWFTHRVRPDAERHGGERRSRSTAAACSVSYGEIEHAIESPEVQRYPIQLEWVINQEFEIDHYQPLLFVVDSFDHLFELVGELEAWMRDGKLDNVAPGEPAVSETDLESFLVSPFLTQRSGPRRCRVRGEADLVGQRPERGVRSAARHQRPGSFLDGATVGRAGGQRQQVPQLGGQVQAVGARHAPLLAQQQQQRLRQQGAPPHPARRLAVRWKLLRRRDDQTRDVRVVQLAQQRRQR